MNGLKAAAGNQMNVLLAKQTGYPVSGAITGALAQDDPDCLRKHHVQINILDKLQRIYRISEHMAISVLPRGVLAGELST